MIQLMVTFSLFLSLGIEAIGFKPAIGVDPFRSTSPTIQPPPSFQPSKSNSPSSQNGTGAIVAEPPVAPVFVAPTSSSSAVSHNNSSDINIKQRIFASKNNKSKAPLINNKTPASDLVRTKSTPDSLNREHKNENLSNSSNNNLPPKQIIKVNNGPQSSAAGVGSISESAAAVTSIATTTKNVSDKKTKIISRATISSQLVEKVNTTLISLLFNLQCAFFMFRTTIFNSCFNFVFILGARY